MHLADSKMTSHGLLHQAGFTLMEAMIVLGLLAIAVSLAVPSYSSYVIRTHRTEAIDTLLATAACQERLYIRNNSYDTDACEGNSANGYYTITVTTSNSDQNFAASAAPQGSQNEDSCGTLSITDLGVKSAGGEVGEFAQLCWSGRHASASS